MNRLRLMIDSSFDEKSFDKRKKKAIAIVNEKIRPLENAYVAGKFGIDDFLSKIDRFQKDIIGLVNIPPIIRNTMRFAKRGELFATNTLIKRINNAEQPGVRKRLPDE